jgi:hypothetical protein
MSSYNSTSKHTGDDYLMEFVNALSCAVSESLSEVPLSNRITKIITHTFLGFLTAFIFITVSAKLHLRNEM